jgi:hypothetical protein
MKRKLKDCSLIVKKPATTCHLYPVNNQSVGAPLLAKQTKQQKSLAFKKQESKQHIFLNSGDVTHCLIDKRADIA